TTHTAGMNPASHGDVSLFLPPPCGEGAGGGPAQINVALAGTPADGSLPSGDARNQPPVDRDPQQEAHPHPEGAVGLRQPLNRRRIGVVAEAVNLAQGRYRERFLGEDIDDPAAPEVDAL